MARITSPYAPRPSTLDPVKSSSDRSTSHSTCCCSSSSSVSTRRAGAPSGASVDPDCENSARRREEPPLTPVCAPGRLEKDAWLGDDGNPVAAIVPVVITTLGLNARSLGPESPRARSPPPSALPPVGTAELGVCGGVPMLKLRARLDSAMPDSELCSLGLSGGTCREPSLADDPLAG